MANKKISRLFMKDAFESVNECLEQILSRGTKTIRPAKESTQLTEIKTLISVLQRSLERRNLKPVIITL